MKKKYTKLIFYLLTVIILGVFVICLSCRSHAKSDPKESTSRNLLFEFDPDDSIASVKYNPEDLANNYAGTIQYFGFEKVDIYLDEEAIDLCEAIKNKKISVEALISYARSDAKNGFCVEKKASKNGLTTFSYFYSDCDITYIDDIYETPDGQQHYMQYFGIYPSGKSRSVSHGYYADGTPFPYKLDREDWGITLNLIDVTPANISIECTQNDGQQIGYLKVVEYSVSSESGPLWSSRFSSQEEYIPISKDATSEIQLDWTNIHDDLDTGTYTLEIRIRDFYDANSVHPLMQNFYDEQRYFINFTIPYLQESN